MPLDHSIDHIARLVTISGPGRIADAGESAGRLLADDELGRDFSILLLIEESAPPEPTELMTLIELLSMVTRRFDGRIAIAAAGVGQLTPALLLTMMVDDGQERIRAFATVNEARVWVVNGRAA